MAKKSKASTTVATPARTDPTSSTRPAEAVDPRCRGCDSTDLLVVRKLGEQLYAGIGPDGKPYTSIIRRRCQCRHCGMHQITIQRPFDPAKWVGELPE